ncbi:hypothetical protein [Methylobacterium sp. WL6]|uniref:hypothetical protein n=1 Tax=Methylobacterium sp. WL6 TaxID=2603901 RepID=UPI0011C7B837|nr:hypothetical protein [Methylobacterium sp. WL6]TXN71589.1 hypothetical protein FV230_07905 [Methylobacterium sp. WL6]
MADHSGFNSVAYAMLEDITKALGASVESFFGADAQASKLAMTNEMLSLWLSLKSDENRAVILKMVRAAIAAQVD